METLRTTRRVIQCAEPQREESLQLKSQHTITVVDLLLGRLLCQASEKRGFAVKITSYNHCCELGAAQGRESSQLNHGCM